MELYDFNVSDVKGPFNVLSQTKKEKQFIHSKTIWGGMTLMISALEAYTLWGVILEHQDYTPPFSTASFSVPP